MNERVIVDMIRHFPIGGVPVGNDDNARLELLCKAEIVAYLARFQEQFSSIPDVSDIEELVKSFLGEVLQLKDGEVIPELSLAERILRLSSGFMEDYNKVQYVKENHNNFSEIYDEIAYYCIKKKSASKY